MSAPNDGGSAFPRAVFAKDAAAITGGMTLRDYFAAKAMQGLLASDAEHGHAEEQIFQVIADVAYQMADAMLAEREVKP